MTRFARAKGSKASNERAPEDGTPWEVMKQQLLQAKKDGEESKKRHEAEQQRIENYENFLKEQKTLKRPASWCEFPEAGQGSKNTNPFDIDQSVTKKKKKNKNKAASEANVDNPASKLNLTAPNLNEVGNKSKDFSQDVNNEQSLSNGQEQPKKKGKNKKKNLPVNDIQNTTDNPEIQEEPYGGPNNNQTAFNEGNIKSQPTKTLTLKKKKNRKLKDSKPERRKAIDDKSFKLIINGKDVDLVRYDGFPIMKKDAERLEELKKNMHRRGIPKSEIQRNMKLERRRAEKALARLRREVCYNCRKGGHNLSDCPDLKSKIPGVDGADGVCFKCGSTEHRQFECKVQKSSDKEFRFASCFICREQGHIARQCPDNPKGLYPNGGSCKLCGDVTHLRKDCPTDKGQRESSTFKLQTLDSGENIEEVDQQQIQPAAQESTKKPKKIKF